jgi:hypothetical protein
MTSQAALPLPSTSSAVISDCGRYRYLLTRQLDASPKVATFIMLNFSTADARQDDPTIRRCTGFAHRWGLRQARRPEPVRLPCDRAGPPEAGTRSRQGGDFHSLNMPRPNATIILRRLLPLETAVCHPDEE